VAAETSIVTGIAGRYATALFALAEEQKQLDPVAADLDQLQGLIAASSDLARLVRSPVFGSDEQSKAMGAVLQRAGAHDLVRRFVGVVARNRRLFVLEQMIRDFRSLLARHRGEVVAQVTSAKALSAAQLAALKASLKSTVGREVTVDARIDAALIGGMVVRVGSRMLDSSIRTKLQNLKIAMKGVA